MRNFMTVETIWLASLLEPSCGFDIDSHKTDWNYLVTAGLYAAFKRITANKLDITQYW